MRSQLSLIIVQRQNSEANAERNSFILNRHIVVNPVLKSVICVMRRSNRNFDIPPPPPGKPRAFELLKIGWFKFPPPRAKMVFKCPTLSSDFVCQMLLLKSNCRRFLSSVIKLVYIRGTRRHQFKMETYFRRWLRGTRYALELVLHIS